MYSGLLCCQLTFLSDRSVGQKNIPAVVLYGGRLCGLTVMSSYCPDGKLYRWHAWQRLQRLSCGWSGLLVDYVD